jgi:hypothetical protein
MKKALFAIPFLALALGCGGGSQSAAAHPQSGRISVSPNPTLQHCIGTAPGQAHQKIGPSPATMNY